MNLQTVRSKSIGCHKLLKPQPQEPLNHLLGECADSPCGVQAASRQRAWATPCSLAIWSTHCRDGQRKAARCS